jgi:hypothetical protein
MGGGRGRRGMTRRGRGANGARGSRAEIFLGRYKQTNKQQNTNTAAFVGRRNVSHFIGPAQLLGRDRRTLSPDISDMLCSVPTSCSQPANNRWKRLSLPLFRIIISVGIVAHALNSTFLFNNILLKSEREYNIYFETSVLLLIYFFPFPRGH